MVKNVLPSLNTLSARHKSLCRSVHRFFLDTLLGDFHTPVVLACSGGMDSIALAVLMHCVGMKPIIAHLDHKLRAESIFDAQHVENFAQSLDLQFVSSEVDILKHKDRYKTGIEETARIERYRFLEDVRLEHGAQWIVTAHHIDDLCEDVLLRLIRGTGWPALAGMAAVDHTRHILRPLLHVKKIELHNFLQKYNIKWVDDVSNTSMEFKRNRIRHMLLPFIEEENPRFFNAVYGLWTLAHEDKLYWDERVKSVLCMSREENNGIFLSREYLVTLPKALRLRVYLEVCKRLKVGQGRSTTFFLLDDAVVSANGEEKLFQFPGGIGAILTKDELFFSCCKEHVTKR